MTAILHDKFPEFLNAMRTALQSDKDFFNLLDLLFETAESTSENGIVASKRRELLGDNCEFLSESTRQMLVGQTIEFIKKYKTVLTGFYVPQSMAAKAKK